MKEGIFRKGLVVGIIILFIGASVIPIISGSIGRTSSIKLKVSQSSMNCYAYGETWNKESNTVLSPDKINEIYNVFTELKHEIVYDPLSDETQALKIEFVDLLDENGLIPDSYSKDDYVSLLNPSWLNGLQNNNINNVFNELKYAMSRDPLSKNTQMLKMEFVNLLDENGAPRRWYPGLMSPQEAIAVLRRCFAERLPEEERQRVRSAPSCRAWPRSWRSSSECVGWSSSARSPAE